MKLTGLKDLYKSMKQQNIDRYQFDFTYYNVKFDVLYFIDEVPNKLGFGIKTHNYYFETEVKAGFYIREFIEEISTFYKIMKFKSNKESPFKPSYFFEVFNKQIPNQALRTNVPRPSTIATYRKDVDEADKIYFKGWINHKIKKVSPENLDKTKKLLSYKAYVMCKNKNISSSWSPNPTDEKQYDLSKKMEFMEED
ncbi:MULTISPECIES: DUF6037 family protein [Bacillaceae]|uniref:DUF6037 family protein n=1 Tax=Bacillaceae TaxID=186817 RepID=UPI0002EC31A3|nr:DUF6037 family protein [Bacillus sp. B1-b2]KAB7670270.1 hypothetical protein F9279_08370 [Bacillus sp. B1-b2]MDU1847214.1 DUF6037 family protein [Niallia nealsonii]SLL35303.1 Uncharacterised protein [Mycobacteroides abscessus subsp. abscessus]HEO8421574.1 hypothetical protein [Yersinia enterocolitica]